MMKYLLSIGALFCLAFAIAAEARGKAPFTSPMPIPTATPPANAESNDSEESLLPFYDNFLAEYVLGPEDVISVDVFGHANYSKAGIVVPPTARISYPLIRGGIFVGGKTTEQVAEIIQKELNEYIIDPQVTVTLDKVGSARFSVLGRVATPGIRPMNRKYSLYEAIAEAGGIVEKGDRNRVVLVRMERSGQLSQSILDLEKMLQGKQPVPYLQPGDQIIVPEKRWSLTKIFDIIGRVSAIRVLLGSPL